MGVSKGVKKGTLNIDAKRKCYVGEKFYEKIR